jgi:hypothetical protein
VEVGYLKDWHLRRDFGQPLADELYQTPPHFADDWLDAWSQPRGDDFRFVYAGPAGSWTALHHDVLCSYSWSANVAGCKRWYLFAPGAERLLVDEHGALVPDARPERHGAYAAGVRARLASACAAMVVVEQSAGQVLFVPAGWRHQVHNTTDCVSINHNWTDGVGIAHVWRFLEQQASEVRRALSHLAPASGSELAFGSAGEYDAHCELVLRADTGMGRADALRMALAGVRRARPSGGGRLPADGSVSGVARVLRELGDGAEADDEGRPRSALDAEAQALLEELRDAMCD